jgi:hypothetical protein
MSIHLVPFAIAMSLVAAAAVMRSIVPWGPAARAGVPV